MQKYNWRKVVKDPDVIKLFEALENPDWDFRTVDGLAKSTGMTTEWVRSILKEYSSMIREFPFPRSDGKELFTLAEKAESTNEAFAKIQSFASKSRPKK